MLGREKFATSLAPCSCADLSSLDAFCKVASSMNLDGIRNIDFSWGGEGECGQGGSSIFTRKTNGFNVKDIEDDTN